MTQILTVSCKLNPTPEQIGKLNMVLENFAKCCNFVHFSTPVKLTNQIALQSLIYKEAREVSGLSSQLTIHAIRRVCANRKVGGEIKSFAPTSATYDSRTFSLKEINWVVSLTVMKGREKISLDIGEYQKALLRGRNPKSATLTKRKDGVFFFQMQIENEAPEIGDVTTQQVLGVDLGRTDIAVTSDGEKFSGKVVTQKRDKFAETRASLQHKASKGTRSTRRRAKQVLQRLSGRERRFQSWLNHTISRHVVKKASLSNRTIALENLTGIRDRTNSQPRNKTERRRSNSWAFHQLRTFIEYKAIGAGVHVEIVDPRYTSQTCHKCKVLGDRQGKKFTCLNINCGWVGDADCNGAINISNRGAVNHPGGSEIMSCSLQDVVLRATESLLHNRITDLV